MSKDLYNKTDLSSYSNSNEVITTHIQLEWDIDFDSQTITGSIEHIVKILVNNTDHVDFDSSNIKVDAVIINGDTGEWKASEAHPVLGTKLSVMIPTDLRVAGTSFSIQFNYSINNTASAMQWLPASATKGLQYPFLFTQSQAIHARSLMPCMDSPGIKSQYIAKVTAPKWCTVLMSALADNTYGKEGKLVESSGGKQVFLWTQPVPTSAYLIALAAGRLESREISTRVRVWAEPEVVDDALYEFSETEQFIQAAEELTGCPYLWHRYDILCLPPSFPYGGMENPCLTFATPTLLAGDRSLADVIAHEIAHSWTGNLVTNHTWDHFWLNEGWTVWLERKITSKVRQNEEIGKLSTQIGWKHLLDDIELQEDNNSEYTSLVWSLPEGEDPDNAYSSVPYEKGCSLLLYLEELVGKENFLAFLKSYIETFKFSTVTTGEFRDHFVLFFESTATLLAPTTPENITSNESPSKSKSTNKKNKNKNNTNKKTNNLPAYTPFTTNGLAMKEILNKIMMLDWNDLFLSKGIPKNIPNFKNSLSIDAENLANIWIQFSLLNNYNNIPNNCKDINMLSWSASQKNIFLETFLNYIKNSTENPEDLFPSAFLELLDKTYEFSVSKNCEIMFRWQQICILCEVSWILPNVVSFISSQGRMKYVRPLYRLLRSSSMGKQIAIDTFESKKDSYHPIARKMIGADLKKANDVDEQMLMELNSKVEADMLLDMSPQSINSPWNTPFKEDISNNPLLILESSIQFQDRFTPTVSSPLAAVDVTPIIVNEQIVSEHLTPTITSPFPDSIIETYTTVSTTSPQIEVTPILSASLQENNNNDDDNMPSLPDSEDKLDFPSIITTECVTTVPTTNTTCTEEDMIFENDIHELIEISKELRIKHVKINLPTTINNDNNNITNNHKSEVSTFVWNDNPFLKALPAFTVFGISSAFMIYMQMKNK